MPQNILTPNTVQHPPSYATAGPLQGLDDLVRQHISSKQQNLQQVHRSQQPEVDKVPEPANLVRRKDLVISGSAENIQRNQTYEFIIVDFQHLVEEKITVLC